MTMAMAMTYKHMRFIVIFMLPSTVDNVAMRCDAIWRYAIEIGLGWVELATRRTLLTSSAVSRHVLMRAPWCCAVLPCSPPRFLFMALEGEEGQGSAPATDTTGKQGLSGTIKELFAGRLMNYIEVGCLESYSKTCGQQRPGL